MRFKKPHFNGCGKSSTLLPSLLYLFFPPVQLKLLRAFGTTAVNNSCGKSSTLLPSLLYLFFCSCGYFVKFAFHIRCRQIDSIILRRILTVTGRFYQSALHLFIYFFLCRQGLNYTFCTIPENLLYGN